MHKTNGANRHWPLSVIEFDLLLSIVTNTILKNLLLKTEYTFNYIGSLLEFWNPNISST